MKKILSLMSIVLILTACSLGNIDNTPTKQVEEYLNNYQTLDKEVLVNLDTIVNSKLEFNDEQRSTYRDILKKHFQDLVYKIKEETVNGDKATIEVEIEVNDYTKVLKQAESYRNTNESKFMNNNNIFDETKFNDYKLDLLKKNKERVKYTLYLTATKEKDKWVLDDLTQTEQDKILGIYEY